MARDRGEGGVFKMVKKGVESRFWYIQYYQGGRPIRVSSGTEVKQEALAQLRKLMGDRDQGAAPANEVKRLRYADLRRSLISHYDSQGKKSLRTLADGSDSIPGLRVLDEFCGYKAQVTDGRVVLDAEGLPVAADKGVPVTALTTDFARRFVSKRRAEGTGTAAINRSLAALRRMFTLAKKEGKVTVVPYIEFQKEPNARKGFLERADFNRLIEVLPTHLRPLVTFLYKGGCRIGETLLIEWKQVDLDAREIRLEPEQTKTDEGRIIPLGSQLTAMLAEIQGDSDGKVFNGTNLQKEWKKACAAVGLGTLTEVEGRPYDPIYSGLTLHDLRRSAVRNLRRAGVSETEAMKISGHKTPSVFRRYNIVSTDDLHDSMRKLELAELNESEKPVISAKGGNKPARKVLTGAVEAGSR